MPVYGSVGSKNGQVRIPRDYAIGGVLVGIPSFGMVSVEFMNNINQQAPPINFSMAYFTPKYVRWNWEKNEPYQDFDPIRGRQIPVDEARNIITHFALENGMQYVFFRDDDVLAPGDSINRLYWHDVPIIAAPYWSKQKPPHSLILMQDKLAGYEEFEPGEILECMATGMGCTLIKREVFEAIDPPWFKTVHGIEMNDIQDIAPNCGRMTEDVYFCKKAAAKGYKILIDTALICSHQDFKEDTVYYYHSGYRMPVWQRGNIVEFIGKANSEKINPPELEKSEIVEDPVKIDMGGFGGSERSEGYLVVNIDPGARPDIQCDFRDIDLIKSKYKKVVEVKCEESLEHLPVNDIVKVLGSWKHLLVDGGVLHIQVPDMEWVCKNFLENGVNKNYDENYNDMARIFGHASSGTNMQHLWGFTESSLRSLLESCGYTDVSIEKKLYEDENGVPTQQSLIAKCVSHRGREYENKIVNEDGTEELVMEEVNA